MYVHILTWIIWVLVSQGSLGVPFDWSIMIYDRIFRENAWIPFQTWHLCFIPFRPPKKTKESVFPRLQNKNKWQQPQQPNAQHKCCPPWGSHRWIHFSTRRWSKSRGAFGGRNSSVETTPCRGTHLRRRPVATTWVARPCLRRRKNCPSNLVPKPWLRMGPDVFLSPLVVRNPSTRMGSLLEGTQDQQWRHKQVISLVPYILVYWFTSVWC